MPLRDIPRSCSFSELPFDKFNTLRISVYAFDYDWNFLYVNNFVRENLGERGNNLEGKNLWEKFPELLVDPVFVNLKNEMELGNDVQVTTTSPITGHKLSVTGYMLSDCYVFSSAILPKKEELINDLRNQLRKKTSITPH